jgi:hypothetical protein
MGKKKITSLYKNEKTKMGTEKMKNIRSLYNNETRGSPNP